MATAAETTQTAAEVSAQQDAPLVFTGPKKNFVTGVSFTAAGLMAFSMGLTHTFFVEATAWTFLIWGVLFIYSDLLQMNETYTLTDETLTISNAFRFWGLTRVWPWADISRMDAVVKRNDPKAEDVKIQVYYTPADQPGVFNRADMAYNPDLVGAILERANLKPQKDNVFTDVNAIPQDNPGTYQWMA
jgi:hypothetical protein